MKILILENPNNVAKKAANIIESQIIKNPKSCLGLATGHTMIPIYKELSILIKKKKTDLSKIQTFNIDEYCSLAASDKNPYHYYMKNLFFRFTNIRSENIHFPSESNYKKYDNLIKSSGNLNLLILGIGKNGHIAFNEPGSSIKSKTRIVSLSERTRKSNAKFFKNNKTPKKAITIGISIILKSKKIILIATGKDKADIISKTIKSKISSRIPATFLKKHRNVIFILDKDAASKLNNKI